MTLKQYKNKNHSNKSVYRVSRGTFLVGISENGLITVFSLDLNKLIRAGRAQQRGQQGIDI